MYSIAEGVVSIDLAATRSSEWHNTLYYNKMWISIPKLAL